MKLFVEKLARLHDFLTTVSARACRNRPDLHRLVLCLLKWSADTSFNSPTAWVSDFVSYTLAASMFLALPKVTQQKEGMLRSRS